jgi:pathogenesis-related protein 1
LKRRSFLILGASLAISGGVAAQTVEVESTGSKLSHAEVETLLKLHNDARADVGVNPLAWSPKMAEQAQKWADYLASSGTFRHSDSAYGENLAGASNLEKAVSLWLAEKATYRNRPIGRDSSASGHYTQMVWSKTKLIGCGKAKGSQYTIFVCNYDPPGNMRGERPY